MSPIEIRPILVKKKMSKKWSLLLQEHEDKPEDCIPAEPGNEEARNFLANAPTKGLWMPLGKEVKVMQCEYCTVTFIQQLAGWLVSTKIQFMAGFPPNPITVNAAADVWSENVMTCIKFSTHWSKSVCIIFTKT